MTTETVDKDAEKAVAALVGETLSDGIDLVNAAALAILEQAAEHADPAAPWLDTPYTTRRLSRRVYIRTEDSRAYRDETTTPIQEVCRAVRQAVQDSRATQTDPRNGYTYIEDNENGLETIYYRLHKYADLGGYNCDGNYTADRQTVEDYENDRCTTGLDRPSSASVETAYARQGVQGYCNLSWRDAKGDCKDR